MVLRKRDEIAFCQISLPGLRTAAGSQDVHDLQVIIGHRASQFGAPVSLQHGGHLQQQVLQGDALNLFGNWLVLPADASGDVRQLAVFYDIFSYTDTMRLARLATILDEAA